MTIYFLRHASAGQHKMNPAEDAKRPLDQEGIEQSQEIGKLLAAAEVNVDVVIASPLVRAVQTAELVAAEIGFKDEIAVDDAMRPDASYDDFRELVKRNAKRDAIMVTGHDPSISAFVSLLLTAGEKDDVVEMKKGAVAKIERKGSRAVLLWCVTPKLAHAAQRGASDTSSARPKTSRK